MVSQQLCMEIKHTKWLTAVLTSEDFKLWKRDLHLIITRAELYVH